MDDSMSYQAPPQQMPAAQPPQPSNPPHGAHALNNGPQPGTAPASQHSQAGPASGQAYGPHSYTEPTKPKKGQQLWNRMKRKWAVQRDRDLGPHFWVLASSGPWGSRQALYLSIPGVGLTLAFTALTAAPGTGGLKFNIQKRPFAVTSQSFSSSEGQHSGFGPQPNPEKAQNHR